MALQPIFSRAELLLGNEAMDRIASKRVAVFGVGGVGSWCAESLIRSGVRLLTIVDSDRVCITNINRQLMATTETIGRAKVEALKDKALLILMATQTRAKLFSSMGAALKLAPTRIKTAEFWKVQGNPLARALRKRFKALSMREMGDAGISPSGHEETRPKVRRDGQYPQRKFLCVYLDELLENKGLPPTDGEPPSMFNKPHINGTLAHITAIYGFMLAGLVVQDIVKAQNRT